MKIICVNKEQEENEIMKDILEKVSYCQVIGEFLFENQAVEFLKQNYVDAIFIGTDDIDSLKDFNKQIKKGINPYVMVAIASKDSSLAIKGFSMGFDGFLSVPIKEEELLLRADKLKNDKKNKKPVQVSLSGSLSINIKGKDLFIERSNLEEFLVYLIYQNRTTVKEEDIISDIYGDGVSELKSKMIFRQLCFSLREICMQNGLKDLFSYENGTCTFKYAMIDCDLYNYIEEEIDTFDYSYLSKYKWVSESNAQ